MLRTRAIAALSFGMMTLALVGCSDDDDGVPNAVNPPAGETSVRAVHAVPGGPTVDIFADGDPLFEGVSFFSVSAFETAPAGDVPLEVFNADDPGADAIVSETVRDVPAGASQTVTVAGVIEPAADQQSIQVDVFPDDLEPTAGSAEVRIIHLSPDAPAVDVIVGNEDPDGQLLASLSFGEATADNVVLPPGTFTVTIFEAGTETAVGTFDLPPIEAGENYTVFAVGLLQSGDEDTAFSLQTVQDT